MRLSDAAGGNKICKLTALHDRFTRIKQGGTLSSQLDKAEGRVGMAIASNRPRPQIVNTSYNFSSSCSDFNLTYLIDNAKQAAATAAPASLIFSPVTQRHGADINMRTAAPATFSPANLRKGADMNAATVNPIKQRDGADINTHVAAPAPSTTKPDKKRDGFGFNTRAAVPATPIINTANQRQGVDIKNTQTAVPAPPTTNTAKKRVNTHEASPIIIAANQRPGVDINTSATTPVSPTANPAKKREGNPATSWTAEAGLMLVDKEFLQDVKAGVANLSWMQQEVGSWSSGDEHDEEMTSPIAYLSRLRMSSSAGKKGRRVQFATVNDSITYDTTRPANVINYNGEKSTTSSGRMMSSTAPTGGLNVMNLTLGAKIRLRKVIKELGARHV